MKKNIIAGLVLFFCMSAFGIASAADPKINDIPADHWAYPAIKVLMKDGIIDGYSDGSFQGDRTMTRYEMAQIVEKAIENSSKANVREKALIDKLAAEFALELNNIDVRVKKVEDAQKSTMKIGFDSMNYAGGDSPPAGQPKEQGNQEFRFRWRMYLSNDMNEQTNFKARLTTSFGDAGMGRTSSNNPMIGFDRAYFTTKDFLGFDSVIWGRQPFKELGGNIFYQTGNNDGVTLIKKLSPVTTLKTSALVIKPEPTTGVVGNAQELQFVSLTSKVAPNLKLYGTFVNNNTSMAQSSNWLNYAYSSSKVGGIAEAYTMGRWTLLGEYDKATLQNPVNVGRNPHGYAFHLTSGTAINDWFGWSSATYCDLNKVGDNAFTVAYRNNQPGVSPGGLGGWNGGMIIASNYLANGVNPSGTDGVKGWMVDYQYVVAKGIQLSVDYQRLKYSTTGAPLDDTYYFMVMTYF